MPPPPPPSVSCDYIVHSVPVGCTKYQVGQRVTLTFQGTTCPDPYTLNDGTNCTGTVFDKVSGP